MKYYCTICKRETKTNLGRCRSCAAKIRMSKPENNPRYIDGRSLRKNCTVCNKVLGRYNKSGYCRSCTPKSKEKNPNYKHGLTFNKLCKCSNNINYYATRCWACWKKEISELYQGKGNPAWQGGKSFEPYPLGWTNIYKEQIRLRDNYTCQLCGKPEIENCRRLSIHHIDYDKSNLNVNNLLSLCNSCHSKTNTNQDYWKEYFLEASVTVKVTKRSL